MLAVIRWYFSAALVACKPNALKTKNPEKPHVTPSRLSVKSLEYSMIIVAPTIANIATVNATQN